MPLIALAQILWSGSGTFWRSAHAGLLGDGWVLHTIACNYLDHGVFSYIGTQPTLMQLPGYPFILAEVYRGLGRDPRWIYALQILITCLFTPFFIFHLRPYLGKWRWLFALVWIFDVHHLLYTTCLTTEFMIGLLWMGAWLWTAQGLRTGRWSPYSLGMVCLGAAAWIKPLSLYVVIFFWAAVALSLWGQWKRLLTALALGVGIYALCLAPLLVRNFQICGEFPRYTTISSFNFWYFNIPYYYNIKGEGSVEIIRERQVELMRQYLLSQGKNIEPIPPQIARDRQGHIQALGLDELEYSKIADELSSQFMQTHFFDYLKVHLRHGLQVFTVSNLDWLKLIYQSYDAHSFGFSFGGWKTILMQGDLTSWLLLCRILEVFCTLSFCALALVGTVVIVIKGRFTVFHGLAWAMVAYIPLVCGVNVWGRFRFLIMPMLIFLAIDGIKNVWEVYQVLVRNKSTGS